MKPVSEVLNLSRGDKIILGLKASPFITVVDPGRGIPTQTLANIPGTFVAEKDGYIVVDQDDGRTVMRRAWPLDDVYVGVVVDNPLVAGG